MVLYLLKKILDCLKEIGIDGINFSIDTLDLREYFLLTQQDCLETVLDNFVLCLST